MLSTTLKFDRLGKNGEPRTLLVKVLRRPRRPLQTLSKPRDETADTEFEAVRDES
jgi:hypothetical protein